MPVLSAHQPCQTSNVMRDARGRGAIDYKLSHKHSAASMMQISFMSCLRAAHGSIHTHVGCVAAESIDAPQTGNEKDSGPSHTYSTSGAEPRAPITMTLSRRVRVHSGH